MKSRPGREFVVMALEWCLYWQNRLNLAKKFQTATPRASIDAFSLGVPKLPKLTKVGPFWVIKLCLFKYFCFHTEP